MDSREAREHLLIFFYISFAIYRSKTGTAFTIDAPETHFGLQTTAAKVHCFIFLTRQAHAWPNMFSLWRHLNWQEYSQASQCGYNAFLSAIFKWFLIFSCDYRESWSVNAEKCLEFVRDFSATALRSECQVFPEKEAFNLFPFTKSVPDVVKKPTCYEYASTNKLPCNLGFWSWVHKMLLYNLLNKTVRNHFWVLPVLYKGYAFADRAKK